MNVNIKHKKAALIKVKLWKVFLELLILLSSNQYWKTFIEKMLKNSYLLSSMPVIILIHHQKIITLKIMEK